MNSVKLHCMKSVVACFYLACELIIAAVFFPHYSVSPRITRDVFNYCNIYSFSTSLSDPRSDKHCVSENCVDTLLMFFQPFRHFLSSCSLVTSPADFQDCKL